MKKRHKQIKVGKKQCSTTKSLNCQRMNMSEKTAGLRIYEFLEVQWKYNI